MRGPGGLCDIPNDGCKGGDYVTFVIDCIVLVMKKSKTSLQRYFIGLDLLRSVFLK